MVNHYPIDAGELIELLEKSRDSAKDLREASGGTKRTMWKAKQGQ